MRAKRTDENQRAIVSALRSLHCSVAVTSNLGCGFPDLCIGYAGRNYLFELKVNDRSKLTDYEQEFFNAWRGQVAIIKSVDEAIEYFEKHIKGKKNG